MPHSDSRARYPLTVLFESYRRCFPGHPLTDRAAACRQASEWLSPDSFPSLSNRQLATHLIAFADAVVSPAWHTSRLDSQVGFFRHGVNHLIGGSDPDEVRFGRCVSPGGTYAVVGGGRTFWAAVFKAIAPDRHPDWTTAVERGLESVGAFDGSSDRLTTARDVYQRLRAVEPTVTADQLDHFFTLAGRMRGREIGPPEEVDRSPEDQIRDLVRAVRVRTPLRERLMAGGKVLISARRLFERALETGDAELSADAVVALGGPRIVLSLPQVRELLDAGPESAAFDEFTTLGLVVPSVLFHLHDPKRYPLWRHDLARGLGALDDAYHTGLSLRAQYGLLCDVADALRERYHVHPLEIADVIAAAERPDPAGPLPPVSPFHGFSGETFDFLGELAENNRREWMDAKRDRYQFFVREPVVELCTALAERYIRPVLTHEYGWELETDAQPGRALTSIAKNDYGRTGPYLPELWITYYRRQSGGKRHDAQLFVRVGADGLWFGFHLGRTARDAGKRFRKAVQEHGEPLFRAAAACGAVDAFAFTADDEPVVVRTPAQMREWATGKRLTAERRLPPGHPLLRSDDLVGEILIGFDRLIPLFAAAIEDDPLPVLRRRGGEMTAAPPFDRAAFRAATSLTDVWLARALELLSLKKQLILHGVPGTGKTHVARSLARLLTNDRGGAVRMVQFHPAYSYEEFVEGIRPRSVEANGRTEVTYPVEDGVLCEFAAEAEAHPSVPHVLVVDEINRGNLPRIFGELLFLLEYRDQAVTLPHSRRAFKLPPNLYLIGTMNSADRSTLALDQALRRRFSFVEMPADAAVLASWLEANGCDASFGPRVVHLFEELNRKLARDLGPDKQIGHSFFMVPGLTEVQLRTVWEHHVRPLLGDYFAPRGIPTGYDLDRLLESEPKRKREPV